MTRFWLTLTTVVLMLALPLFAPAEHRGVAAMIIWLVGLAVVSCLAWPHPAEADGSNPIIAGQVARIKTLEQALYAKSEELTQALSQANRLSDELSKANRQQMTLALGVDPRIETVYGSAEVDRTAKRDYASRPQLVDHRHTQSEDVVSRWVREGRKTWASTALRTSDGLYFLRDGAPVNLISNLEQ